MHTALHALVWGLQRLGVGLAILLFVPLAAYVVLVICIVAAQGVAGFGQ